MHCESAILFELISFNTPSVCYYPNSVSEGNKN